MKRIPQLRWPPAVLALTASLQITAGYYDPAAQRWINRDPVNEVGLRATLPKLPGGEPRVTPSSAFILNAPLNRYDSFEAGVKP